MKAERAEQRRLFLKNVGKLRKGWQDVPTRKLLRQRRVLVEDLVAKPMTISQAIGKVRAGL